MKKGFRGKAGAQDGFTFIELLIVFLILSILVSIVVMTMMVSKSKAQRAACKANLRIIADAITQYRSIHDGETPPDLNILAQDGYIKASFKWTCPMGPYGTEPDSGDYRNLKYYNSSTGETSCPRADHNI